MKRSGRPDPEQLYYIAKAVAWITICTHDAQSAAAEETRSARQAKITAPRRKTEGRKDYMQSRQAAPMVPAALPSVARMAGGQPMISDAKTYLGSFALSGFMR